MRRLARVALVAITVSAIGGCAAVQVAPRQAPLPSTPAAALDEIAALERRIAEAKHWIGGSEEPAREEDAAVEDRAARSNPAGGAVGPTAAPPPPPPPPAPASTAPRPARQTPPADEAMPVPSEAEEAPSPKKEMRRTPSQASEVAPPAFGKRSARCRRVQQAAEEICHAASRICAIAAELAVEDARARCRRAGDDCVQARGSAATCNP